MSSPMRHIARGIARQNGTIGHKRGWKNEFMAQQKIDREEAAKKLAAKKVLPNLTQGVIARIRNFLRQKKEA